MPCPSPRELLRAVEGKDDSAAIDAHIARCNDCAKLVADLRDETEGLSISIGRLWLNERISCPHDDILLAFVSDSLTGGERDYIAFHLDVVGCPYCQARVAEFEDATTPEASRAVETARDRSLESARQFFEERDRP